MHSHSCNTLQPLDVKRRESHLQQQAQLRAAASFFTTHSSNHFAKLFLEFSMIHLFIRHATISILQNRLYLRVYISARTKLTVSQRFQQPIVHSNRIVNNQQTPIISNHSVMKQRKYRDRHGTAPSPTKLTMRTTASRQCGPPFLQQNANSELRIMFHANSDPRSTHPQESHCE